MAVPPFSGNDLQSSRRIFLFFGTDSLFSKAESILWESFSRLQQILRVTSRRDVGWTQDVHNLRSNLLLNRSGRTLDTRAYPHEISFFEESSDSAPKREPDKKMRKI